MSENTPPQQSNSDFIVGGIKGIVSLFVTPLSLIAVMFLFSLHFCSELYGMMNLKSENSQMYIVGIYFMLGIALLSTLTVLFLTITNPDNLTYDKAASLLKRGFAPFGQDGKVQKGKQSNVTTTPNNSEP